MEIRTIDVSHYQLYTSLNLRRKIDWGMVKICDQNIRGVVVKHGEGFWAGYPAESTRELVEGVRSVGLPVATYHYAYGEYSVAQQGGYIRERTAGHDFAWYAGDFEYASCPPRVCPTQKEIELYWPQAQKNLIFMRDYLDMLDQVGNKLAVGYSGYWWMAWLMWIASVKKFDVGKIVNRPWWVASYTPVMKNIWGVPLENVVMWQYTEKGPVAGMPNPTHVDMNLWLKGEGEFKSFWGMEEAPVELTLEEKVGRLWGAHKELWIVD